jgi:hypothetical protein
MRESSEPGGACRGSRPLGSRQSDTSGRAADGANSLRSTRHLRSVRCRRFSADHCGANAPGARIRKHVDPRRVEEAEVSAARGDPRQRHNAGRRRTTEFQVPRFVAPARPSGITRPISRGNANRRLAVLLMRDQVLVDRLPWAIDATDSQVTRPTLNEPRE